MKNLFLLVFSCVFFVGCATVQENPGNFSGVQPPYHSSFSESRDKKEELPPDLKKGLELEEAIDLALENNPGIQARKWEASSSRAEEREARSRRLPQVNAVGTATRYLDEQRVGPATSPSDPGTWSDDQFGADLVLELPLFTGGVLLNREKAAKLFSRAANHRLSRTREETVYNVTSTFYAILKQRQVLESQRFSRKAVQRQKERIQAKIEQEKGIRLDLLRVNVRLSDIEQKIIAENNRLDALHRLLATQLGIKTKQKRLAVNGSLDFEEQGVRDKIKWENIYSQREDYLAQKNRVVAARKSLQAANGKYWPSLNLRGTYGGRWAAGDYQEQPGGSTSEDVGSVGLQLELPLFTGGEISAGSAKASAELSAARQRLRELGLEIRQEVQNARDSVLAEKKKVQSTREAVQEAKEALNIEQSKYEMGKSTIVDVLDTQDALLRVQTNHARALAGYKTALARLELAKGNILKQK